jgi:hypothetical protein
MVNVEQIWPECQKNKRVCPQPQNWQKLYELLPNKKRQGNEWEPPLPLILAAWWETPVISKTMRFREHIEWAEAHGCLEQIAEYLKSLSEDEWYHIDDKLHL